MAFKISRRKIIQWIILNEYSMIFNEWYKTGWVLALVVQKCLTLQATLSMEFPRQECWSGLPLPSPKGLPNPGIKPGSPALQADPAPAEPPGKPQNCLAIWLCWNVITDQLLKNTSKVKTISYQKEINFSNYSQVKVIYKPINTINYAFKFQHDRYNSFQAMSNPKWPIR